MFRSSFTFPRLQIEIRAGFLKESVDDEADPCRIRSQAEPELFSLTREEDLAVLAGPGAEEMMEGSVAIGFLPVCRVVRVAETFSIRRKGEAAQIAARQNVRQYSLAFDFEELESPRALPAFFDLEEQQPSVR